MHFGAVLWIKENIFNYKGNENSIAVTGDSAGAYISAMIVNSGNKIATSGSFSDHLCITPSYVPESITAEDVKNQNLLDVQAAVLSYGAYNLYSSALKGIFETRKNPFWTLALSKPRGSLGIILMHKKILKCIKQFLPFITFLI